MRKVFPWTNFLDFVKENLSIYDKSYLTYLDIDFIFNFSFSPKILQIIKENQKENDEKQFNDLCSLGGYIVSVYRGV